MSSVRPIMNELWIFNKYPLIYIPSLWRHIYMILKQLKYIYMMTSELNIKPKLPLYWYNCVQPKYSYNTSFCIKIFIQGTRSSLNFQLFSNLISEFERGRILEKNCKPNFEISNLGKKLLRLKNEVLKTVFMPYVKLMGGPR